MTDLSAAHEKPKVKLLNDPKFRSYAFQAILVVFLAWVLWGMISNAADNLKNQGLASGFDFLTKPAGFGLNFSPFINYTETSSLLTLFFVGLQNTLVLAVVGIFFATILGFLVGVARLSNNWVINRMAYCYVEVMRNIPLLLQIFIWYKGVGAFLPAKRNPADLGFLGQLNAAGLYAPKPVFAEGAGMLGWALLAAFVITWFINRWAKKRQMETGERFPVFWTGLGLIIGLPVIAYFLFGQPVSAEYPTTGNFGPRGGMQIIPEFIALLIALTTYTAAFIAEIVRAGILAVNRGQTEASYALGLRPGQTLRLNIIPQAMRVIIPPLTSQYLNLTKNSSLAVAIAYPDLTASFAGTALNVIGQAVEMLGMTMLTYLAISLVTSLFMNWYNAKVSLVER
ncbi:MAG: amino acid ABC transporter permease [Pseudomonadota bacterium]